MRPFPGHLAVVLAAFLLIPSAAAEERVDGTTVCDRVIGHRQIDASVLRIRLDQLNEELQREAYDTCERNIGDEEIILP